MTRAIAVVVLAAAGAALAQKAEVTTPVVLRERPDEHARIVERVGASATLSIVGRSSDGAWLEVRVGRREGWAPKGFFKVPGALPPPTAPGGSLAPPTSAKADAAPAEAQKPHLDGWANHDGPGAFHARKRMRGVVLARADVHARTDEESRVVTTLLRGAVVELARLSLDEAWGLVTTDGGDVGWVSMRAVRIRQVGPDVPPPAGAEAAASSPKSGPAPDGDVAALRRALVIPERNSAVVLGAGGGIALVSRRFVSNGAAPLAAYELSTVAAAATVEGAYLRRFGRLVLGVDGDYAVTGGSRVQYRAADGSSVSVRLQAHDADGGLRLGVHARGGGGVDLWLRAGVALDVTIIDPDARVRLASDRLIAPTAGVGLAAPHLVALGTHWLGLAIYGRALVAGQLTENLSDGQSHGTFGARFGARLALALAASPSRGALELAAAYSYGFTVTRFSGASTRDPSASAGTLGTAQHLATLALAWAW